MAEDDHSVLLRRNRNGRGRVACGDTRLGTGGVERSLPIGGPLLAARRGRRGVRGATGRHDGAGVDIAHLDLARGRGRVDPDHQGH